MGWVGNASVSYTSIAKAVKGDPFSESIPYTIDGDKESKNFNNEYEIPFYKPSNRKSFDDNVFLFVNKKKSFKFGNLEKNLRMQMKFI